MSSRDDESAVEVYSDEGESEIESEPTTPRSEGFDYIDSAEHSPAASAAAAIAAAEPIEREAGGRRESFTDRFKRYMRRILPGHRRKSAAATKEQRKGSDSFVGKEAAVNGSQSEYDSEPDSDRYVNETADGSGQSEYDGEPNNERYLDETAYDETSREGYVDDGHSEYDSDPSSDGYVNDADEEEPLSSRPPSGSRSENDDGADEAAVEEERREPSSSHSGSQSQSIGSMPLDLERPQRYEQVATRTARAATPRRSSRNSSRRSSSRGSSRRGSSRRGSSRGSSRRSSRRGSSSSRGRRANNNRRRSTGSSRRR